MDRVLSQKPHLTTIICTGDQWVYESYFVQLNKPKKYLFICSLMTTRFQNVTFVTEHERLRYLNTHQLLEISSTTNFERLKYYKSPNSTETFRSRGDLIILGTSSYNFITCDESKSQINFAWLTNSFSISVWIVFIIIFAMWLLILHRFLHSSETLLFSFALFLEQSFPVPGQWLKHKLFVRTLVPMFFGSIILTNCYKSLFVTDLTAPRPQKSIDSLEELSELNYSIYSPLVKGIRND